MRLWVVLGIQSGHQSLRCHRVRQKVHLIATTMEVELKDTLNKTWKEDKTGFGFRMMQKMGWKEDKGLGKNESGIVDNVKIAKRETGLGLGSKDIVDGANRGWSETATSFNAVLDVLKQSFAKENDKKKKKVKKTVAVANISVGMK
jgi:hypothetical protein